MKTNKPLSLGLNIGATFIIAMMIPLASWWAWLLAVQVTTTAAMARDKWAAKFKVSRVPEAVLLSLTALGGSPAILITRRIINHKSSKQPFSRNLYIIVAVQIILLAVVKFI